LAYLKTKHLVDFRFQITHGLSYENFKYNVSEVWEVETVPEAKSPEKPEAAIEPKESGNRTQKSASGQEGADKTVNGNQENAEKKEPGNAKPNAKRRYTRRKPAARKGPPRGRYRRPNQASKPAEEGAPSQNATSDPIIEPQAGKPESSKDNNPPDLSLPLPPMPMPYVRESTKLGGEPPVSNEPAKDGAGD
jgi:hypothetical protein